MGKKTQRNFVSEKYNIKIWIFSLTIIASVILLLLVSYFSKSPLRLVSFGNSGIFFEDCIEELANWNSANYSLENSIYHTPFVCLIYHILSAVAGEEIQTALEISHSRQIMTFLIIFFGFMIFVFFKLLDVKLLNSKLPERIILSVSLMVTGPFIYWVSSGNLIFISLVCCCFYLMEYDNDNGVIRAISYLSLAIAVGISFYPIVFEILSIEKRKRESVYLSIISILFFSVPYIKYGGIELETSLKAIIWGTYLPRYEEKSNYNLFSIMNRLSNILLNKDANVIIVYIIGIVLCILLFKYGKKKWKKIFACSLFLVMFSQPCLYHNLLFMYMPLLFFLENERENGDGIYLFSFIIMFIPFFTVSENINYKYFLYEYNIFSILGMMLICLMILGGEYAFKIIQR